MSSDLLHSLIKSLSGSEKRYFRISFSQAGDDINYVKLFDAIDKLKGGYDEYNFKKKNAAEAYSYNFPYQKHYLYEILLNSLISYHKGKTIKLELLARLQKAEILLEKKLPFNAIKIIQSAKKIAGAEEMFSLYIYILEQEYNIYNLWEITSKVDEKIKELDEEKKLYMKKLLNLAEYTTLNHTVYKFCAEAHQKETAKFKKGVRKFLQSRILKDEKHPLSRIAATAMYHTNIIAYSSLGDYEKCCVYQKKLLSLYEERSMKKTNEVFQYILGMQNYLFLCIQTARHEEFSLVYEKLNLFLEQKSNTADLGRVYNNILIRNYNLKLNYYLELDNFEEGMKFVRHISMFLEGEARKLNSEEYLGILFNAANIYFSGKDYENALYWLNKILLDKTLEIKKDLIMQSLFMNFIIHYELKNYELLLSLHSQLSGRLRELEIKGRQERTLAKLFKKLASMKDKDYTLSRIGELMASPAAKSEQNAVRSRYLFIKKWAEDITSGK
jgi:hypothetical protein